MKKPTMAARRKEEIQKAVYRFIVEYKRSNDGVSPSYREIMEGAGLVSTSTVRDNLIRLERRGVVKCSQRKVRAIQITGEYPAEDAERQEPDVKRVDGIEKQERDARIFRLLFDEGWTYREISRKFNLSLPSIYKIIREERRRRGVVLAPSRRRALSPAEKKQMDARIIQAAVYAERPVKVVAREEGVSAGLVYKILEKYRKEQGEPSKHERNGEIVHMVLEEGRLCREASERYGVSLDTVYRIIREEKRRRGRLPRPDRPGRRRRGRLSTARPE